jgi:hypothetical protein
MSYSRSYTKTIRVYYAGVARGTKYVNGQSIPVSLPFDGHVDEPVTVYVKVDTDSFDSSVRSCNKTVDVLTGSVVATEAAQIKSIREKSRKVGKTIIDGFFTTVKSEISQQIAELTSRIDSDLLHLKEMARRCVEKQKQMEVDYQRLTSRYSSIFEDLNKELENRIYELDRPTFKFKEMSDKSASRSICTDMASTVAVSGAENSHLETLIGVSLAKKRALDAIDKANVFLVKQKSTERLLETSRIKDNGSGEYHAPVCFIETAGENNVVKRKVYCSQLLDSSCMESYIDVLKDSEYSNSDADTQRLKQHFSDEVADKYAYADSHNERVRDYITKMFNKTIQ